MLPQLWETSQLLRKRQALSRSAPGMTRESKDVCLQMVCHLTSVRVANAHFVVFSCLPLHLCMPSVLLAQDRKQSHVLAPPLSITAVSEAAGTDAQSAMRLFHYVFLFSPTAMHAQCTVTPRLQAKPCAGSTSVSYCWCLKLLALMHRFQLFPGQLCHFTTGECVCPEQWYHCLHPVCLAYGGRGHCHLAVPVWSPWKGNTTAQGS